MKGFAEMAGVLLVLLLILGGLLLLKFTPASGCNLNSALLGVCGIPQSASETAPIAGGLLLIVLPIAFVLMMASPLLVRGFKKVFL